MSDRNPTETGTITRTRTQTERTTREFVVEVLKTVFHRAEQEAIRIMLHVHHNGVGIAGVYTYEVAEMKVRTVEALARQREFPLMLSIEPEE